MKTVEKLCLHAEGSSIPLQLLISADHSHTSYIYNDSE